MTWWTSNEPASRGSRRWARLIASAACIAAHQLPALGDDAALARRRSPVVEVFSSCHQAVVNISSKRLVEVRRGFSGLLDPFFEERFLLPRREIAEQQSVGSGFVVHPAGYIVTNAHVVVQTVERIIIFADQSRVLADAIAVDSDHDLAILKVRAARPLSHVRLGRSNDLMIGETAIAIGNPLGLQHTCTAGIISALNRKLTFQRGVTYDGLIQTDTSINPGNSGGPLLNVNGEVIGINTAIRGDAQNIGFAIPVDRLRQLLPTYLDVARLRQVEFGLHLAEDLDSNSASSGTVRISRVDGGSPAEKAGLRPGDEVAEVAGRPVRTFLDAFSALLDASGEDGISIGVRRGGAVVRQAVRWAPITKSSAARMMVDRFGIEVREMTDAELRRFDLDAPIGLVVTRVQRDSDAGRNGLSRGDFVTRIGKAQVRSLITLGQLLQGVAPGTEVAVGVLRIDDDGTIQQGDMYLRAK